jgi:hypothetical protein
MIPSMKIHRMIFSWLREALQNSPYWKGLYQLTKIHIRSLNQDPSADWWNKVQSICRKVETTVDPFDPIAEIHKLSERCRIKDEPSSVKINETNDIPGEYRTSPMSQTELANLWGGDMMQKKIRAMIDSGTLRAIKQSRQTFIFDKRQLPEHVKEKLRKLEQS